MPPVRLAMRRDVKWKRRRVAPGYICGRNRKHQYIYPPAGSPYNHDPVLNHLKRRKWSSKSRKYLTVKWIKTIDHAKGRSPFHLTRCISFKVFTWSSSYVAMKSPNVQMWKDCRPDRITQGDQGTAYKPAVLWSLILRWVFLSLPVEKVNHQTLRPVWTGVDVKLFRFSHGASFKEFSVKIMKDFA